MDFTMTHVRFGRSHLHPMGQLTHTRRSAQMVILTHWTLKVVVRTKSVIIATYTWTDQTQSLSYPWQWILHVACMTTSFVWFSCMLTVKHLLWLMNCGGIGFVSFEPSVSLILRVLLVWSWRKCRLCGFQAPWTFHLGHSYLCLFHPFTSSRTTFSSFPRTFSSAICLSGICWVFISAFHRLLWSS